MKADTPSAPGPNASEIYRAFWRWHFHAGLLILPVLILMALTGGLYLFRSEIESVAYRPLMAVAARPAAAAPSAWVATAESALGGRVVQVVMPATSSRSARLVVDVDGDRRLAFVDPGDGRLLGSLNDQGLLDTIKQLHSLEIVGPWANVLVEVVAGWAIVMVATGVFLWWPRGAAGGVLTVRWTPGRRLFWRDLHAVAGLLASGIIVFLAATGMPWSAVWGDNVRRITNAVGWGAPQAPAPGRAWMHEAHGRPSETNAQPRPWALQGLEMPSGGSGSMATVSIDGIVAQADAQGMPRPFTIGVPASPGKAWTVTRAVERAEDTRTLYFDAADGVLLADVSFDEFGPAAKAITWGIAVHQGEQYGPANRYIMLAGCLAIWVLAVSAIVMWWKRRPRGRLAAPPPPRTWRGRLGVLAVVVPLAILYPLVGVSLISVLALDLLWRRVAALVSKPAIS